jgi:hypothetical protein
VQVLENQRIPRSGAAILGERGSDSTRKGLNRKEATVTAEQTEEEEAIFAEIRAEKEGGGKTSGSSGGSKKTTAAHADKEAGKHSKTTSSSSSSGNGNANDAGSESGTAAPPTYQRKPELSPQILESITFGLSILDIVPPKPVLAKLDTALLKIILDVSYNAMLLAICDSIVISLYWIDNSKVLISVAKIKARI